MPADAWHTSSDRPGISRLAVRDEVHSRLSWPGLSGRLGEMAIYTSASYLLALVDREQRRRRKQMRQE